MHRPMNVKSCFTLLVKALGSYDFHCGMWHIQFLLSVVLTYMHAYMYIYIYSVNP